MKKLALRLVNRGPQAPFRKRSFNHILECFVCHGEIIVKHFVPCAPPSRSSIKAAKHGFCLTSLYLSAMFKAECVYIQQRKQLSVWGSMPRRLAGTLLTKKCPLRGSWNRGKLHTTFGQKPRLKVSVNSCPRSPTAGRPGTKN